MTFSLHQGRVVMSSQITHTQSPNIHPLAHIHDTQALIFSSCTPFYSLSLPHHITASLPSPDINHQSTGGRSERTQCQAKWPREIHSVTYAPGLSIFFLMFLVQCCAASTVIPLLSKATFTPSIQPNLGLPCTHPSLTSAINTLLDIRYLSILSTCPNHLNTL